MPTLSVASSAAPWSSSNSASAVCPLPAAQWSAVKPARSAASSAVPRSSSNSNTAVCPLPAAWWSNVVPLGSIWLVALPSASSSWRTRSIAPSRAASRTSFIHKFTRTTYTLPNPYRRVPLPGRWPMLSPKA
eukprot:7382366-Prymnesium_polylepis.1